MSRMAKHVGPNGVVTAQAVIATLEEEISVMRKDIKSGKWDANGERRLKQAIDEHLDRIAKLKRRI